MASLHSRARPCLQKIKNKVRKTSIKIVCYDTPNEGRRKIDLVGAKTTVLGDRNIINLYCSGQMLYKFPKNLIEMYI